VTGEKHLPGVAKIPQLGSPPDWGRQPIDENSQFEGSSWRVENPMDAPSVGANGPKRAQMSQSRPRSWPGLSSAPARLRTRHTRGIAGSLGGNNSIDALAIRLLRLQPEAQLLAHHHPNPRRPIGAGGVRGASRSGGASVVTARRPLGAESPSVSRHRLLMRVIATVMLS
jgi:hypothetical protein